MNDAVPPNQNGGSASNPFHFLAAWQDTVGTAHSNETGHGIDIPSMAPSKFNAACGIEE
jgi:hypothetical protein